MCGVAGILDLDRASDDAAGDLRRAVETMTATLVHRGPDDQGVWLDADAGLAFGHRRLSIIDLSPTGSQPMISASGRWVLTYNGEVYNADELRAELEPSGVTFRGHSDTEVILEACAAWGVPATVEKLIGMFAFGLWDRSKRELWLVRDRLGIKPLYWGRTAGGTLLFASELKALRAHPDAPAEIDRDAIAAFMRLNYIPDPLSVYRGVHKLAPGHLLRIGAEDCEPEVRAYWSIHDVARRAQADRFRGSDAEAIDALDELLRDAVGRRMVADVPLGAFLSGGIDSSTVVALMQAQSERPVRSFSIGFHEAKFDEATHAREVAAHLGTEHTELYVSPEQARAVIPELPAHYDEPFSDSSQIPTYLVSAMTREHVKVALSGDGGDELFAGYNRYDRARRLGAYVDRVPNVLGAAASTVVNAVTPDGARLRHLTRLLAMDRDALYRHLVSHWPEPNRIVIEGREPAGVLWDDGLRREIPDFTERMQFKDLLTYLPGDILTKVDRASMAVSLEARVPILDHRVVEFALRLPYPMKVRDGQGKWLLRQVLDRYVPRELIDRPKMGFGVPIGSWLRGPLREWAEDLLSEQTFRRHGLLHAGPVRRVWAQYKEGRASHYPVWDVLMLHAWADS